MMTPDRRAKLVELAEAFRRVNNAKSLLDTASTDPYCQNSVIEMLEDGLDAAAERLDKAMKDLMMPKSVSGSSEDSNPTAARPQE
jgi:hypothetical protein